MSACKKNTLSGFYLGALLLSPLCHAWSPVYGHGNSGYYEPGPRVYHHDNYAPNVIINVPVGPIAPYPPMRPYYVRPACEEVEVCNRYDECWIESYCP